MKLRIVKHVCADGVERGILEYRNHWWEKWKPLHQDGKLAYVSYMGTKPCKSVQEECFDVLGLSDESRKTRISRGVGRAFLAGFRSQSCIYVPSCCTQ